MATKGTIVPGILSSRSRTPLPKLMQSSTGRFMPSVTGSPFDDELLLRSAFVSFSVTSDNPSPLPRRSPIDPTCLRLKTPLPPRPASPAFIPASRLTLFFSVSALPLSFLFVLFYFLPGRGTKSIPRFFSPPPRFFQSSRRLSAFDTARFRRVCIQRARSFSQKR